MARIISMSINHLIYADSSWWSHSSPFPHSILDSHSLTYKPSPSSCLRPIMEISFNILLLCPFWPEPCLLEPFSGHFWLRLAFVTSLAGKTTTTNFRNYLAYLNMLALGVNIVIQYTNVWVLLVCRLLIGIFVGLYLAIVPIYIH